MSTFKDEMRARFHAAQARQAEIEEAAAPLRTKYEKIRADITKIETEKLAPIAEELREIEAELFEVKNEIGGCVRFLRDGTGMAATGDPA